MDERVRGLTYVLAASGGAIAAYVNDLTSVLWVLLVVMTLDIVSGLLYAGKNGEISSSVGLAGLRKKALTLVVILAIHALEPLVGIPQLDDVVAGWFVFVEIISILENAIAAQVAIPRWLLPFLKRKLEQYGEPPAGTDAPNDPKPGSS